MKNPLRTIGTKEPMTTTIPPYDPASPRAEEFINHEEILATLEAARADAADLALVDRILEKAAEGNGLTHREASVLLACEDKERIERIFALAVRSRTTIMAIASCSSRRSICRITA